MLCAAVFLNHIQFYITEYFSGRGHGFVEFIAKGPFVMMGSSWAYHLWFLNCLMIYVVVLALIWPLLQMVPGARAFIWVFKLINRDNLYIVLWPLFMVLVYEICIKTGITTQYSDIIHHDLFGFVSARKVIFYSIFFLFGLFLYKDKNLLDSFANFKIVNIVIFSFSILILYFDLSFKGSWLLVTFCGYLINFQMSSFCFTYFKKFVNSRNERILLISDSAYKVYLFHMIIVLFLGGLLIEVNLNIFIKFLIVTISTIFITYLLHRRLIIKNSYLRFLFNGEFKDSVYEKKKIST